MSGEVQKRMTWDEMRRLEQSILAADGPLSKKRQDELQLRFDTSTRKHYPFPNNEEYYVWCENNCWRCRKGVPDDRQDEFYDLVRCEIEFAIQHAYLTGGGVTDDIAQRLGLLGKSKPAWDCMERER